MDLSNFLETTDVTYNLDKFRSTNILLITGLPGSGKTTLAKDISKSLAAEVVHLDTYYESPVSGVRNEVLDGIVHERLPELEDIYEVWNEFYKDERFSVGTNSYEYYWSIMDEFRELLFSFTDRPKILEGIHIGTKAFINHHAGLKELIKQTPTIIRLPDKEEALKRMNARDDSEADIEWISWWDNYFRQLVKEMK